MTGVKGSDLMLSDKALDKILVSPFLISPPLGILGCHLEPGGSPAHHGAVEKWRTQCHDSGAPSPVGELLENSMACSREYQDEYCVRNFPLDQVARSPARDRGEGGGVPG